MPSSAEPGSAPEAAACLPDEPWGLGGNLVFSLSHFSAN